MMRTLMVIAIVGALSCGVHAGRIAQLRKSETAQQHRDRGNSMIAKVIEMLGQEKDKIKANLATEAATMAEYTQWCDDTQTELSYAIKSADAKIEDLTSVIDDNTAQIKALDEELHDLGKEIAERQKDMDHATKVREEEHAQFLKAEEEQMKMVEELESMGVALKKQMESFVATPPPVEAGGEAAEAPAFFQMSKLNLDGLQQALTVMVNSMWVDPESQKNLALLNQNGAFVQEDPAAEAPATVEMGADQVAAQQKANNENLDAFEGLKGKSEETLQRQRDEEAKLQADYEMSMMSLKQAVSLCENNVDDAKKDRARLAQEKAEAEEELATVEASRAADQKTLRGTTDECNAVSEAWAARQEGAKNETAAIQKAIEILSSRVTVLMQVANKGKGSIDDEVKIQKVRQALVNHFRDVGNRIHSLAMLNLVSVSTKDPMAQVKNLLKDLIAKLEKEAAEAASLHQFCQEEKKKTTAALEKKDAELDKLGSRIEKASTKKQDLEDEIADGSEEIASIDKQNAEATKLRNEEHDNFAKEDADFSQAAEAVDDAIDALKEYYGDSAFVQTSSISKNAGKSDAPPPTFGGAKSDSAGGIIGILETMGEEFRKTVKDGRAAERESVKAYETMMKDNQVSKATTEAVIKGAESEIKSLTTSLHESEGDQKMVQKEKDAVTEYVEKLKPQCQGRVVPYAERKAKMEAEIAGLKDGLAILEEGSPAGAFSFLQIREHGF